MVIHPRNLNLGERIQRFAEWSPRGKQLVGPAAAAAAAPRRPPAPPGRPPGTEGRRAAGPPRRRCPGPARPSTSGERRHRRFPTRGEARSPLQPPRAGEGSGGPESRRSPEGEAPWAPPRPRLLLWCRVGQDGRPFPVRPSPLSFLCCQSLSSKELPTAVSLTLRGRSPPSSPLAPAAY